MKDNKQMAKMAMAALVLAASLPMTSEAAQTIANSTYLAVAGCGGGSGGGHSCGGKSQTSTGTGAETTTPEKKATVNPGTPAAGQTASNWDTNKR